MKGSTQCNRHTTKIPARSRMFGLLIAGLPGYLPDSAVQLALVLVACNFVCTVLLELPLA